MVGRGDFRMQASKGGGGGGGSISLVQGKVTALAAMVEPNLWHIYLKDMQEGGFIPPLRLRPPPPLAPWEP